jgi:hypothetical protein
VARFLDAFEERSMETPREETFMATKSKTIVARRSSPVTGR